MEPATLTPTHTEITGTTGDLGRGSFGGGDFGDHRGDAREWRVPARAYRTGMWMALVAIVMLFAAFTSALVVRKGLSGDWVTTELPGVLWLNTLVLVASSATLEASRRSLKADAGRRFKGWLYVTVALGLAFLAGQLLAWRELASRGVYLSTNPSSSFFYLLTATHGVHLAGGVIALLYVALRAGRIALAPASRTAVEVTALYWHFMDGLWIYIFVLLMGRG